MIVESGDETAGVIVDEVEEVLTVEESDFEEVPGADSELIDSIAKLGDRLVVLLKPSTIFVRHRRTRGCVGDSTAAPYGNRCRQQPRPASSSQTTAR